MLLCFPMTAAAANITSPASSVAQTKKPLESSIKYANVVYRSGNRRDPFINPLLVKKKDRQSEDEEISRGLPPPGIAGTYIAQAMLQGIASRDTGTVAVFRGADSRAYFLRKGDKLFDGYLKEIHDDSVTLVRETKLRSGKILTQDVTKRLRTP
jgi:Tfp pilus assembly protein PilP